MRSNWIFTLALCSCMGLSSCTKEPEPVTPPAPGTTPAATAKCDSCKMDMPAAQLKAVTKNGKTMNLCDACAKM